MKKALIIASLVLSTLSMNSFAVEKSNSSKKGGREITAEQREKMATVHEKLATCLRSNKAMAECRKEMRESCKEMMGKDSCPMMGGKMGKGMMGGEMMGGEMMEDEGSEK